MDSVRIFQFHAYDFHDDRMRVSKRWGTHERVSLIPGASVLSHTATEVDPALVMHPASDIEGLTVIGWMPKAI